MGKVDYNTFIAMLSELNDFIYKWDRDYVLEVKAIDDRINIQKLEPRPQDVMDVLSILKAFGEKDILHVKNEWIASSIQYFPSAVSYIHKECYET